MLFARFSMFPKAVVAVAAMLLVAGLVGVAFAIAAWDTSEFSVRTTVENAAKAAEADMARADISSVQQSFSDDARWLWEGGLYD